MFTIAMGFGKQHVLGPSRARASLPLSVMISIWGSVRLLGKQPIEEHIKSPWQRASLRHPAEKESYTVAES
jgi:hypothetical protein